MTRDEKRCVSKLTRFSSDPLAKFRLPLSLPGVCEVHRFVAREEELSQLRGILSTNTGRCTAVIHGLGGIGKTQLAIAYCKRHRTEYSTAIWLNARDESSLKQSFACVAERILRYDPSMRYIALAVDSRDAERIVEGVQRWLDEPANDGWLLICDSYDRPAANINFQGHGQTSFTDEHRPDAEVIGHQEQTGAKPFDLRPYLPQTDHGAVIITSRYSAKMGQPIKLGKLQAVHDSLEILASTSSRNSIEQGK